MNRKLIVFIIYYCLLLPHLPLRAKQEEVKKAEQDASDNAAHDSRSDNTNLSYCGSLSQTTQQKYQDGKQYYETFNQQLLDELKKEHGQLIEEATLSDSLESKIDKTAGQQFSQSGQEQAKDIDARQKKLKREIEDFKKNTILPLEKKNAGYTGEKGGPRELPALTRAKNKLREMERQYNRMGRPLEKQQGNILSSEASLRASDRDNESGAYAQSGCTYNQSTGECTLTGPLYQNNERLIHLARRGVQEAEKFAKLKVEQLQLAEIKNAHNSDYKLFEALLSDKDNPESRKTLQSNLNLAAKTAAAAKNLSCRPIAEKDSKAYHLYRAASAVFLTALINDTTYYEESANCRATEKFTEDSHNKQINTLEKVTNLHENLFANLCLRTEPEEKDLQEKCRQHIKKIFGPNPKYLEMPHTRDNALKMFKAAHKAALSELKNKWLLIKTANEQIKKGKERIKENQRKLLIVLALRAAAKALGINYDAKANACAARTPTCSTFAQLKAQAFKWWKKVSDYYILEIYYLLQIMRWKAFVKKWQKKLSQAKKHTHLTCNQKEAERESTQIRRLVEKSKQQLTEEIVKEKNKILNSIHDNLKPKTSLQYFDPLPIVLSILLTPAHAAPPKVSTSKSLGLGYGTWSFQQFLLNRNQSWFLLAQDINPHLTWPPDDKLYSLAYLDENQASNYSIKTLESSLEPLLKSLASHKDVQARGFPLPETRVLSTAQTINLIEGNLIDTKNTLRVVANQLDTYVKLLKKAKERLPLGQKGLVESPSAPTTKEVHCAQGKEENLEFDRTCECAKNDSCAKFNFPQFGKIDAPANEYLLVQGIAKDTLKGKLQSANVKSSQLEKKNAIYKSIISSPKPLASSQQNGKNLKNTALSSGTETLKNLSYKNTSKLHQAANDSRSTSLALGSKNSNSPTIRTRNNKKTSSKSISTQKNELDHSLPHVSYFQDQTLSKEVPATALENQAGDRDKEGFEMEHSHKNQSDDKIGSANIHNRTSNIFKIISRRYQKSAYPLFQIQKK